MAAVTVPVVTQAAPFLGRTAQAEARNAARADPPFNIPRTAAMAAACNSGDAPACEAAVVAGIDQARAAEGVAPLRLPSYYDSLSGAEQLLVLANLERADRGLPVVAGLSAQLDALATAGAAANNDPIGPNDASWGSNWAGGEGSALLADYDWMYDDGPGSPNLDCPTPGASGCWDHRQNILGDYGAQPSMGAAVTTVDGVTSMTEIFSSGPAGPLDYAMPAAVPVAVSPASLQIGTTPETSNSAMLTVSDPVAPFRVVAQVAGNKGAWSITPSCTAPPGRHCHLFVTYLPDGEGIAEAMVTVRIPGRADQIRVSAYAGHGYWEATSRGGIIAWGGGGFRGSAEGLHLARPVVGMAATPDGGGYWEVAGDGGVFTFGNAKFFGSAANLHLDHPVVGMAVAHGGRGYWLLTSNGAIYAFGQAKFYGTPAGRAPGRFVGMAATPDGHGYWLVTRQGAVYAFGDARYYGALERPAPAPVAGVTPAHDGHGYWLVTRQGAVYGFGDARYYGSALGRPGGPVVGMAAPASGPGYYLVCGNGRVLAFGSARLADAARGGVTGGTVVAMATA